MLEAGHRRHLHGERPAPREPERRDLRADRDPRARDVPRHILDDADEVVLVDLSPEELQDRLRGQGLPKERAEVALQNFFRADKLAGAAGARSARGGRGRGGAPADRPCPRAAQPAGRRRARARPSRRRSRSSQRILRRAWRSAQRFGTDIDVLWVRRPGRRAVRRGAVDARRPAAACGRPRRALPRGGGRRPGRGGAARRRRARLDLRASSDARRVPAP